MKNVLVFTKSYNLCRKNNNHLTYLIVAELLNFCIFRDFRKKPIYCVRHFVDSPFTFCCGSSFMILFIFVNNTLLVHNAKAQYSSFEHQQKHSIDLNSTAHSRNKRAFGFHPPMQKHFKNIYFIRTFLSNS